MTASETQSESPDHDLDNVVLSVGVCMYISTSKLIAAHCEVEYCRIEM